MIGTPGGALPACCFQSACGSPRCCAWEAGADDRSAVVSPSAAPTLVLTALVRGDRPALELDAGGAAQGDSVPSLQSRALSHGPSQG